MPDKQKNVPYRRFKEFENADAWEQRKLGALGKVYTGNTPSTSDNDNWTTDIGGHVWITPSDIDEHTTNNSERHLSNQGWSKARKAPKNSVMITSIASIGKNTINAVPAAFNQQINAIVPDNNDAYFILSSMNYNAERFASLAGHTATAIINKKTFEKFQIVVPTLDEQKQIGKFFKKLDHLITLHQRKYDKLKSLKSAYLTEMFPAEGERKPKRRFSGFTDDWEQRKFSDVLSFSISNNTISRAGLVSTKGIIKDIHYGDILIKYGSVLDLNQTDIPFIANASVQDYKEQILHDGDVIIADTAEDETTGKAIEITGSKNNYAVSGLHTMVARPKRFFAPGYLGYYLNSPLYHETLLPLMQGIKVMSLSKSNISKTKIEFPKNFEEQVKIENFFERLDHLITLHQQQLEKLKNLKQAYLNEMFV